MSPSRPAEALVALSPRGSQVPEYQLPLPLIYPEAPTGILLRFPWGNREVELPLMKESFLPRELAYLAWVFSSPISETKANHLLFTALPRSYYPGKLIRAGRSSRRMKEKWPTHGHI